MKAIITAAILSLVSLSAVADWTEVDTTDYGTYYTMSEVTEQYGEWAFVALYADPERDCATGIRFVSIVDESGLEPGMSMDDVPANIDIKIDSIDKWVATDQEVSVNVDNKGVATFAAHMGSNSRLLKEIVGGRQMKMRMDIGQNDNWTSTMRYSLDGSARRIAQLLEACAKHDEWGDATWRSNQSDDEWTL